MSRACLIPSELLDSIVTHYQPLRVIVFGSVARGTPGPDSDLDLVIVLDNDAPAEMLSARSAYEARKNFHHAVDILPCRDAVLAERAKAKGSFADIVLREGITVYERR